MKYTLADKARPSDPLARVFRELLVDGKATATLTPEESAEFNRQMQESLAPQIERIRAEQRAAFHRSRNLWVK